MMPVVTHTVADLRLWPAAMTSLAIAIAGGAALFPQRFDWQYQVISALASREDNPTGYLVFCAGLALCFVLLLPLPGYFRARLRETAPRLSRFAAIALRVGIIGSIAIGVEREIGCQWPNGVAPQDVGREDVVHERDHLDRNTFLQPEDLVADVVPADAAARAVPATVDGGEQHAVALGGDDLCVDVPGCPVHAQARCAKLADMCPAATSATQT